MFLCSGRLLLGVHVNHLAVTFILTILTWLAYSLLVIPFLGKVELYLIPLLLGPINVVLLFSVAFSDPGILPRQHFQHGKQVGANLIRKDALVLKSNFCRICNIWRPSRTRHCKYCDNCVDIFDHHCPVRHEPHNSHHFYVSPTDSLPFSAATVDWNVHWRKKLSAFSAVYY